MMAITKMIIDCFINKYKHCVQVELSMGLNVVYFGDFNERYAIDIERLGESTECFLTVRGLNEEILCPRFNQRISVNDVNENLLYLINYSCGVNI